ncbi:hypothetical protein PROFUN_12732 [Planoprotostelium fungivorum]|uniref:Uncharacterized protein n=1 Tax=Planoprotostelium fungivorum TaxID=1890364 RepID=A0A2P6N8J6_9EUKA|nr:hypothetical protein PROFUN_12732 [Planoprotostelium fungivorum]
MVTARPKIPVFEREAEVIQHARSSGRASLQSRFFYMARGGRFRTELTDGRIKIAKSRDGLLSPLRPPQTEANLAGQHRECVCVQEIQFRPETKEAFEGSDSTTWA